MTFRKRGPVTRQNSIFNYEAGTVACPLSTNSWTDDEYFTIDIEKFELVEGMWWCVNNVGSTLGTENYRIIGTTPRDLVPESKLKFAKKFGSNHDDGSRVRFYLYQLIFGEEANALGLVVDHILHWTDNRRSSVDFVTPPENSRRGAALFHHGKRNRRSHGFTLPSAS